jgi:hypothetical protein
MKGNVRLEDTRAAVITVQLVAAIVAYADDEEHFRRICKGVWPECDFYSGSTHFRVLVNGRSNGPSVYVNLV